MTGRLAKTKMICLVTFFGLLPLIGAAQTGIFKVEDEGKSYQLDNSEEIIHIGDVPSIEKSHIESIEANYVEERGQYVILITFTLEGAEIFAKLTTENVNQKLAILANGELISAPTIIHPILDGKVEISGGPDFNEVKRARIIDALN